MVAIIVSAEEASPNLNMSVTDMKSYGLNIYAVDIDVMNRPKESAVVVATYDSAGCMLQIKKLESDELKTTFDRNGIQTIQAFLWDDIKNMKPLAPKTGMVFISTPSAGGSGAPFGPSFESSLESTIPVIVHLDEETDTIFWRSDATEILYYIVNISRITNGAQSSKIQLNVFSNRYCYSNEIEQLIVNDKQLDEHFEIGIATVTTMGVSPYEKIVIHKEYY